MRTLLLFIILLFVAELSSQNVGINTTTPHASSALDVSSTNKGLLIPRMTLAQRNAIATPATGLMIYQTDNNPGFYYYNHLGSWIRMSNATDTFQLPYAGSTGFGADALSITHTSAANFGTAIKGSSENTFGGTGVEGVSNDENGVGVRAKNTGNGVALYAETSASASGSGSIVAYNPGSGNGVFAISTAQNATNAAVKAYNTVGGLAILAETYVNSSTGSVILSQNTGNTGFSIKGVSNAANTAGIRGESTNGVGVNGFSAASIAVAGSSVSGTALKGTSSTGLALETVGNIKLYGGNMAPKAGAVLTSVDALGNAVWKEDNVAFKAFGMNSSYNTFPAFNSTKVHFGGEKFDLGNDYDLLPSGGTANANSSTFLVPVNGVYHFDISLAITCADQIVNGDIRLMKVNTAGTTSILAQALGSEDDASGFSSKLSINTDESLQAGDKIYVEVYHNSEVSASIFYGAYTWFSGHLVKAQ